MRVCIGGTFDLLHKGHKKLIDKAFEVAGRNGFVFIGITTGNMLESKKSVKNLDERINNLKQYLNEKGYINNAIIKPIKDRYGPTLTDDFDAIVVSPETIKTAEEINKKRIENGEKQLKIIQIPFILAKDGSPISSTRIKNKEIDEDGRVLSSD